MSQLLNDKNGTTRADEYIKDGVHPSAMGYLKMACTWVRAIKRMEPVPAFEADRCASILQQLGLPMSSSKEMELMMDSVPLLRG